MQEPELRQRAIHVLWYVVENYPAIDAKVRQLLEMIRCAIICLSCYARVLAGRRIIRQWFGHAPSTQPPTPIDAASTAGKHVVDNPIKLLAERRFTQLIE